MFIATFRIEHDMTLFTVKSKITYSTGCVSFCCSVVILCTNQLPYVFLVSTTMTQYRRDGRLNLCCYIQAPNVTWSYCHLTLRNSPSFLLLVTGSEEDETGIISENREGGRGGGPGLTQTNVYYRNFARVLIASSTIDVIIDFYYAGWLRDWKCSEKFWKLIIWLGKTIYTPAVVGIPRKLIYDWEKSVCVIFCEQRAIANFCKFSM